MLLDDVLMERLINKLVEVQGRENIDVQILKAQLSEIEKGIENILNAIQAGVFTSSTKNRLELLEAQKTDTENALSIAELKNPVLTREQISFFLYRFRKLDITEMAHRRQLIDTFVNAVYLYDDKILLTYNYKDGTKTIDLNTANGSDLEGFSPP